MIPKLKPIPEARLEQLEQSLEQCFKSFANGAAVCIQPDVQEGNRVHWVMSSDIAAMIQELRRRRRKMGYVEQTNKKKGKKR